MKNLVLGTEIFFSPIQDAYPTSLFPYSRRDPSPTHSPPPDSPFPLSSLGLSVSLGLVSDLLAWLVTRTPRAPGPPSSPLPNVSHRPRSHPRLHLTSILTSTPTPTLALLTVDMIRERPGLSELHAPNRSQSGHERGRRSRI